MTTPSASLQAEQQTQTHESKTSFWWLIILLAIVAVSLLGLYFMNFNGGWGNQGDFGTFGDFLGGVLNPILGFATVWLLIWSLKMQREELALTRCELEGTKEAMQAQVTHLQNEAKLNELMRLMSDLRLQFQNQIIAKLFIDEILFNILLSLSRTGEYTNSVVNNVNIFNILYEKSSWAANRSEDLKDFLRNNFTLEEYNQWRELENLLIHFSNIVIKYHELSSCTELTNIYRDEARKMLQPFYDVFRTEAIADQLALINGDFHHPE